MFTDNLVFEKVFYKGISKIPFLFELVLKLHQFHMRGELIFHVIQVVVTQMIEAGIDGLYRGGNLGGMVRGLNTLQFSPLYQGAVAILAKLETCIGTFWE